MNSAPAPATPPIQAPRAGRRFPRWLKRLLLGLLALILLLLAAGALYQVVAGEMDKRSYGAPGELVDVGGHRLHIYCMGENVAGSPTVVLEQGLGVTVAAWAHLQPSIAQFTRTCAYDRAGMGWSDASTNPRDAQHIAAELRSLLHNAQVPGPYVLAGWSIGGLYARMYAGAYPDEVAGLVLLDSTHPDQWTSTAAGQAQYANLARLYTAAPWLARLGVMRVMGRFQPDPGLPAPYNDAYQAFFAATKDWDAQSAEFLASPAAAGQLRSLPARGDIPLFVLTATAHGTPPEQEEQWQVWQRELAQLSNNSVQQVVAGADHTAFWRAPETVEATVAAVRQVVEAASTGEPLQP